MNPAWIRPVFSQIISGPLSAALLADLGADVIKVEPPGAGDRERMVGSSRNRISGHFHMLNRGKCAISMNMREPEGLEIAHRAIVVQDVT